VFEHANGEPLVQRADAIEHPATQSHAVHCRDGDVEALPIVSRGAAGREYLHRFEVVVIDIDSRLVAREIGDTDDQADISIVQVAQQTATPTLWNHRVVVEQNDKFAARGSNPLVARTCKPYVTVVEKYSDARDL